MMYRMFAAAMAAGLLAAVLISLVQAFTTTPLIIQAETFEAASESLPQSMEHAANDSMIQDHTHDANAWAPADGFERFAFTVLANTVTAIAFALLVVVGLTFGASKPDITKGVLIALGGFAAFTLAPVLGLPPELPGMPVGDLLHRQIWWAVTVAASLGALVCLFIMPTKTAKALGLILLIAPHLWGAPHAVHPETTVAAIPAPLAAQFAASSIVVSALLWIMIGVFTPMFFAYFKGKPTQ